MLRGAQKDLLKNLATGKSVFRRKETVSVSVLAPQCPSPRLDFNNVSKEFVDLKPAFEIRPD